MHTIQYIAVQGDDVDEAFRRVKHELETMLGNDPETITNTWFDWFVTGGGRWATGDENQYNDEWQGDVVHQDDPKFEEYLESARKSRQDELQNYLKSSRELDVAGLLDTIENDFEYDNYEGSKLYPLKKIYDMSMGIWDYNSYFFDITSDSTRQTHLKQSIDNGAKNWYLVPVDFHF